MPKIDRETQREMIDLAIEESIQERPAPVRSISRITGAYPSAVRRRFNALGWVWTSNGWVRDDYIDGGHE